MDALTCIMTRRSLRHYTGEAIDDATVETLLRAAMAAPSAGNQQPWRFVVLRDRAVREQAAACSPYAGMLPDAGVGVVVCGDTEGNKHEGFWVQDCSAAIQNMLLAAHALDLGAVWLGFHPDEGRAAALAEVLRLPATVIPLGIVSIGFPTSGKPGADRFEPSFVHTDRW
jgi:nitroreductase